jgi:hypothetical protein
MKSPAEVRKVFSTLHRVKHDLDSDLTQLAGHYSDDPSHTIELIKSNSCATGMVEILGWLLDIPDIAPRMNERLAEMSELAAMYAVPEDF